MATASTSGISLRGKKKEPTVLEQISKFFGAGEKKKRTKGSFRGTLSSPRPASSRPRGASENSVLHFFRSLSNTASSPRPKSRWRDILGLASAARVESARSPNKRRRDQNTLSRIFTLETKAKAPPKRWSTIF